MIRGTPPDIFENLKKKFHVMSIYPPYSEVCYELQRYEDALTQELIRYQSAVVNHHSAAVLGLLAYTSLQ